MITAIEVKGGLQVGVYMNGGDFLLDLDLSFMKARFVKYGSTEFHEFIAGISLDSPKEIEINGSALNRTHFGESCVYVLIPINFAELPQFAFERVQEALLLVYPSQFRLLLTQAYQPIAKKMERLGYTPTVGVPHMPPTNSGHFIKTDADFLPELVSDFIEMYLTRYHDKKYLQLAIKNYVASYRYANNDGLPFSFVSLFICLESLISGRSELTYKIQRCCAVILSDSPKNGKRVFDNLKHLYDLRSTIVHGEEPNLGLLQLYHGYLLFVVSRILIELLQMEITDRRELNDLITMSGFSGEAFKGKYIFFRSQVAELCRQLPKYKESK